MSNIDERIAKKMEGLVKCTPCQGQIFKKEK